MAKRRHRARLIRTRLAAFPGFLLIAALALVAVPQPATAAGPVLLSQGKPATASSTENTGTPASAAVDGDTGTRWSSAAADPQWLQVDLGSSQSVSQVVLNWETAYAKAYQIQISADGTSWTSVYSTTGAGGTGVISGTATSTGTSTVSVTATDRTGATHTAGFVWTVS